MGKAPPIAILEYAEIRGISFTRGKVSTTRRLLQQTDGWIAILYPWCLFCNQHGLDGTAIAVDPRRTRKAKRRRSL